MNFFEDKEFWCKCGRQECDAPKIPHPKIVQHLNQLRLRYGKPIIISSGARCAFWNEKQGGKPDSGHLTASEADLLCLTSRDRFEFLKAIYEPPVLFLRIGIGKTFLHVGVSDSHSQRVCWDYYH